jgi:hypothetical protein
MIRVAVVDDHPIARRGIEQMLASAVPASPDFESYHPTVAGYSQLATDLSSFISSHFP